MESESAISNPFNRNYNYLSEQTREKRKEKKEKKKRKRLHSLRLAFLKRLLPHLHQGIFSHSFVSNVNKTICLWDKTRIQ